MPTDSVGVKEKRKDLNLRRNRSSAEGSVFRRFNEGESLLPAELRGRLHDLFALIEDEYEKLYVENQTLHEKLEHYRSTAGDKAEGVDSGDGTKAPKKSSSQISQKIKDTYKTSTSRIVSTFKNQSAGSHFVREFSGHGDGVWDVSVSKLHQVTIVGTSSADGAAKLWSSETGECVTNYFGHKGSVNSLRFHPSQDHVVTASGDQTAHVWKAQISLPLEKRAPSDDELELSEKEELDASDEYHMFDANVIRVPQTDLTGHSNVVVAADWMAGGREVITASWDRTAILYDVDTGAILNTLQGHEKELTNVCTHPVQKLVVTSSKDTTFRLWDFRNPSMQLNVFQGHTEPVTTAVFVAADKIVSGSDDRSVKIWDLKNMRSPMETIRTDAPVNRLAVSPSHQILAIPQDNRHIRLYDINGVRLGRLPRSNRVGHSRMVCAAAWDEDSPTCNLFTCGFDRLVLGWYVNPQRKDAKDEK
ncbi:WD repeat-containing protein 37 [Lingula anatina]|uniref:WD repeat-containing protein 37 n=1 Tax=Lingula anatina TaxID=7574 RepID=A0A1S3K066_LINAN|nr:WD repeat-containing protein 37 [Lingula anatina]|eukprot:XP_013415666.1 WD repeat-containing protein 37 [Lingula anatina]